MAKFPRVGRFTIAGDEYPAVINGIVLNQLEDRGITVDDVLTASGRRFHHLFMLIALAINEGIQITGSDAQPVTEDEIARNFVFPDDANTITEQLAMLMGNKGRTVEADLPKN